MTGDPGVLFDFTRHSEVEIQASAGISKLRLEPSSTSLGALKPEPRHPSLDSQASWSVSLPGFVWFGVRALQAQNDIEGPKNTTTDHTVEFFMSQVIGQDPNKALHLGNCDSDFRPACSRSPKNARNLPAGLCFQEDGVRKNDPLREPANLLLLGLHEP